MPCFTEGFGRPSKELYTVLGALVFQQTFDLIDEEACDQLAYNIQWHYALNITEESDSAKYICPKTLWRMRSKLIDNGLEDLLFECITRKLVQVFTIDTDKQRIDSVHIKSNIICSIGGTSIGKPLLHLCAEAYPIIKKELRYVRMILVCGPRISAGSMNVSDEIEVRDCVPDLYEHFAACDLAIVQGGAASTLELTALRTLFLFFPIEGHFEQTRVAERLKRHNAGIKMTFSETTPEDLAEKALYALGKPVEYAGIPSDGAKMAAQLICNRFLA